MKRLKDLNTWGRKRAEAIPESEIDAHPEVLAAQSEIDAAMAAIPASQAGLQRVHRFVADLKAQRAEWCQRIDQINAGREALGLAIFLDETEDDATDAQQQAEVADLQRRVGLIDVLLGGEQLRWAEERELDHSRSAQGHLAAVRRQLSEVREHVRVVLSEA